MPIQPLVSAIIPISSNNTPGVNEGSSLAGAWTSVDYSDHSYSALYVKVIAFACETKAITFRLFRILASNYFVRTVSIPTKQLIMSS